MEGFQKASKEWERDNIYFPLDRFDTNNDKQIKDYYDAEDAAGYPNGED